MSERAAGPDSLGAYLQEIGKYPLLTAAQERELAQRIERSRLAAEQLARLDPSAPDARRAALEEHIDDGQLARETFVRSNLRLVVSVARRFGFLDVPLLDLVQEGNLGLLRAVEGFDWRKGFRFSTYAVWWIRQSILNAVRRQGRTIRLPAGVVDEIRAIRSVQEQLRKTLAREPTPEEIGRQLGTAAADVEATLALSRDTVSLQTVLGEEGDTELGEMIADEDLDSPAALAVEEAMHDDIHHALEVLRERDRRVLEARYGLDGSSPRTLEQIAEELGISRERVRQIERRALATLRSRGDVAGLRAYLGLAPPERDER